MGIRNGLVELRTYYYQVLLSMHVRFYILSVDRKEFILSEGLGILIFGLNIPYEVFESFNDSFHVNTFFVGSSKYFPSRNDRTCGPYSLSKHVFVTCAFIH